MKALVTGASGFIGSTLVEELGRLGFEVHALLRSSSKLGNLEGVPFKRVEGSLDDFESLKRAVQGMEYVFHLAGVTVAPSRRGYFEANAEGTARLARAVAESGVKLHRFVYVSSLAAGGPSQTSSRPRSEGDEDRPVSAYGKSKLQGERELQAYQDRFPVAIVRPPIVYGPKDKGVFALVQTLSKNVMPLLAGSGEGGHKYYSAIHVRDLVRGIVQAAVAPLDKVPSGEVFYLTGDEVVTYEDFLGTIAHALDPAKEPIKIRVPRLGITVAAAGATALGWALKRTLPLNWDKRQELLPDYWTCSNEKAKRAFEFSPDVRLSAGMEEAIGWYRRQKWL